jgi:hypothetical protein
MLLRRSSVRESRAIETLNMVVQSLGHDRGTVLADQALEKSALLSKRIMPHTIAPETVIRVLNSAKIRFVLVGAFGIARWKKEARATLDVDVVVTARQLKKAVAALLKAFPHLEAVDLPVVTRLRERTSQEVVIDVMKPVQQPYREVFKHTLETCIGKESCHVPSLEMALVMKFAAMTSARRDVADKYRDAYDFIRMAKHNDDMDRDQVARLASLMSPEGGKDVLDMIDKARAGETLNL